MNHEQVPSHDQNNQEQHAVLDENALLEQAIEKFDELVPLELSDEEALRTGERVAELLQTATDNPDSLKNKILSKQQLKDLETAETYLELAKLNAEQGSEESREIFEDASNLLGLEPAELPIKRDYSNNLRQHTENMDDIKAVLHSAQTDSEAKRELALSKRPHALEKIKKQEDITKHDRDLRNRNTALKADIKKYNRDLNSRDAALKDDAEKRAEEKARFMSAKQLRLGQNRMKLYAAEIEEEAEKHIEDKFGPKLVDPSYFDTAVLKQEKAANHKATNSQEETSNALKEFQKGFVKSEEAEKSEAEESEPLKVNLGVAGEAIAKNEHTLLYQREAKLFGLYDATGSENHKATSDVAAMEIAMTYRAAKDAVKEGQLVSPVQAAKIMEIAMDKAHNTVLNNDQLGVSNASTMKMEVINGVTYGVWANAGTNRMYVIDNEGDFVAITKNSIEAADRTNGIGSTDGAPYQAGAVVLTSGDRVMIGCEELTLQWPDFSNDPEVRAAFKLAAAQETADRLIELSNKHGQKFDNKSIMIIDVEAAPEAADDAEAANVAAHVEQAGDTSEIKIGLRERAKLAAGRIMTGNMLRGKNKKYKLVAAGLGVLGAYAAYKGFIDTDQAAELTNGGGDRIEDVADNNGMDPTDSAEANDTDSTQRDDEKPNKPETDKIVSLDSREGDGITHVIDRYADSNGISLNDRQEYEAYQHLIQQDAIDSGNTYLMENGDIGISDADKNLEIDKSDLDDALDKAKKKK